MIEVISGTNRPNSRTLKVAMYVLNLYKELGAPARVLDLAELNFAEASDGDYFSPKGDLLAAVERVTAAEGLVVVVPEYNGSFPGILKLFIDHWRYPESFEHRPIALVGLGNRWGGLRPVEHLQQVFGYRNGYVFPNRIFLPGIKDVLKDGDIGDPKLADLLRVQTRDFLKFIRALEHERLDANSRLKLKPS
jgi:NAD(P)H-dependent FMN reductase